MITPIKLSVHGRAVSSAVERFVYTEGVAGSIPAPPTIVQHDFVFPLDEVRQTELALPDTNVSSEERFALAYGRVRCCVLGLAEMMWKPVWSFSCRANPLIPLRCGDVEDWSRNGGGHDSTASGNLPTDLRLLGIAGAPDWTEADRSRLFDLMTAHGLTIMDLPQVFLVADVTAAPSRPTDKIDQRLWKLFGQLGSDNPTIRTTARDKLDALLIKQKLGWNELTAILLSCWTGHNTPGSAASPQQQATADQPNFSAFELIMFLLEDYIVATPAQRTVIALWTLANSRL